ncbi:MAG: PIG-L family deacetylase [Isosphaeraceae bacterium]
MTPITRRALLRRTACVGSVQALAGPGLTLTDARSEGSGARWRKLKVVVTGGHPGDPEYGCGGTIARFTDQGHEVVLLYLNDGEPPGKSTNGKTGNRLAEARKACAILKARFLNAGQVDGEAVVDRAHSEAFRKILEAEKPDAVFTQWPIDNHADHRAISMLTYEAWLRMGRIFALYYYEVSNGEDTLQFSPTHYVDITATEPRKRQACYAHASQTPDRFYALQDQVARFRGIEGGYRLAEAYIRHVQSPAFELPPSPGSGGGR